VQLGEGKEPKRASLPKGWEPASMDLPKALQLLSLPREVGQHPETGALISAGLGRYGPFILHEGTYANLPEVDEVFTIGLNRAVDLLAQKAAGGGRFGRGGRPGAEAIKSFEHSGGAITVRSGKYGPYVNQGKVNATLPKTITPEAITLEEAVALITAKAGAPPKAKTARKTAATPKAKAAPKKKAAPKAKAAVKAKAPAKAKPKPATSEA
jgi:DNA topoisomerase-1